MEILSYPVGLLIGLFPVMVGLGDHPVPAKLLLDGAPVCTMTSAAPACTVDLGPAPKVHLLELVRRDAGGHVTERVARWVNRPGAAAEVRASGDCQEKTRVCRFELSWAHPARLDPTEITVSLDGKTVVRGIMRSVTAPFPAAAPPKVLTVEAMFEDGRRASFTQAFQLSNPQRAEASLQALPVVAHESVDSQWIWTELERAGWKVRAVEEGEFEVIFVIEPGAVAHLPGLGQNAALSYDLFASPLQDAEAMQILVADDVITAIDAFAGGSERSSLRSASGAVRLAPGAPKTMLAPPKASSRSLWFRRLLQASRATGTPRRMRTADAVALAGYALGGAPRRRAVVLIAGSQQPDLSSFSPEQAAAYLEESLVPLVVWRVSGDAAPAWPPGPTLKSPGDLPFQILQLRHDLLRQRVVWLEGDAGPPARRPLPDGVSLAGSEMRSLPPGPGDPEKDGRGGSKATGPEDFVYAVSLDARDSQTVYAGTRAGLLISKDGGASWKRTGHRKEPGDVYAIAPVSGSELLVGASGGVSRSLADGENWSNLPSLAVFSFALDATDPRSVLAATRNGVLRTSDGGLTWADSSAGLSRTFALALAADPRSPGVVYAGTAGSGIFKSTDGGRQWRLAAKELARAVVRCVAVAPGAVYAGSDGGIFVSNDQGRTWDFRTAGLPRSSVYAVTPGKDPKDVYAGTSRGIFASRDVGKTWIAVPAGRPTAGVTSLELDAGNRELVAGTLGTGVVRIPLPPAR